MKAYRPDVDGLRAVSIILVFAYHLGGTPFVEGWIGVDVFFVISGFLITGLIRGEIEEGHYSIVGFYERRIRRIFPALFIVTLFVSLVSWFLYMPPDFLQYGESLTASSVFQSNVLFWYQAHWAGGYFHTDTHIKPLLHTWSLAIEEQYYLIFPFIMMALVRFCRPFRVRVAVIVIGGIAALSVGMYFTPWAATRDHVFFLLPWRAWELMTGALLGLLARDRLAVPRHPWLYDLLGVVGLGLIIWGAVGGAATTSPRGFLLSTAFPCVGAGLIILAGEGGRQSLVSRILALRPVVFIGLISYSLYLWHWPLIVFDRYYRDGDIGPLDRLVIVVLATGLAYLSLKWIETPVRRSKTLRRPVVFGAAALVIGVNFGFGGLVYLTDGLPGRLPADVVRLAEGANDTNVGKPGCATKTPAEIQAGQACVLRERSAQPPRFAVLGDSFAAAMLPGLAESAQRVGTQGVILVHDGCYPLPGIDTHGPNAALCNQVLEAGLDYLRRTPSIQTIVVVSRWTSAIEGRRFGKADQWRITDSTSTQSEGEENPHVVERGLRRLADALPGRQLVMVYNVPEHQENVPRATALAKYLGRPAPGLAVTEFDAWQQRARAILRTFAAERSGVQLLDIGALLCDAQTCSGVRDGRSLYSDPDHLNRFGAVTISPIFDAALTPIQKASSP